MHSLNQAGVAPYASCSDFCKENPKNFGDVSYTHSLRAKWSHTVPLSSSGDTGGSTAVPTKVRRSRPGPAQ